MPRQRATETKERDARALAMRRTGRQYQQIGDDLGVSAAAAFQMCKRAMRDLFHEAQADAKVMELDRLDDALRTVYRIMLAKHVATNNAGVIYDRDGNVVFDDTVNLNATRELRMLSESRRKLLGLDAPSRVTQTVITHDAVEAAIRELESEGLAANDYLPQPAAAKD